MNLIRNVFKYDSSPASKSRRITHEKIRRRKDEKVVAKFKILKS